MADDERQSGTTTGTKGQPEQGGQQSGGGSSDQGTRQPTDTSTLAPGTPKPQPGGPSQPAGSPSSSSSDKS